MTPRQHEVWTAEDRLVVVLSPDDVCEREQDIRVALMTHVVEERAMEEGDVLVEFGTDIMELVDTSPHNLMLIECWNDFGMFKVQLGERVGICRPEVGEKIKHGLRLNYGVSEFSSLAEVVASTTGGRIVSDEFFEKELAVSERLGQALHRYYYDLASQDEES